MTVIIIFLLLALFLCSQRYIPCQLPNMGIPLLIGNKTDVPSKLLLIWDVISSGPSKVCLKWVSFSETNLLKWVSKSSLTKGSEFSLIVRLAEVCLIKTWTIPVSKGSSLKILFEIILTSAAQKKTRNFRHGAFIFFSV